MVEINSKIDSIISQSNEKVRKPLPPFKGQYSDEKVLFHVKENIINFIFKNLYILISLIIFGVIASAGIYYISVLCFL